jgi:phosphatidylglycerophosphatase C
VTSATAAPGLAVFDLDGTITYRDTLVAYLGLAISRRPRRLWGLRCVPLLLWRYAFDRDRGALKGGLIAAVLGGSGRAEIGALTDAFVHTTRARRLRPGALAAIARHRERGDHLVLLSASPDLYVPALGAALGFDETVCTELVWTDGALDGRLAGPNRRGEEKRRVVAGLRERWPGPASAYGNAASDLAHLASVEAPLLVNASSAARRAAGELGIPTGDWP